MTNSSLAARFRAAKHKLFEQYYDTLNPCQREAVFSVNGPLLVLAGAGSGKTTVLVRRIAHIIRFGDAYATEYIPEGLTEADVAELEAPADGTDIGALLARYAERPCPSWAILSITFTNKAASEMKERLERELGECAADIWAGTFHKICVRILRRYADRIGYGNDFTIYDTDDVKKMLAGILSDMGVDDKVLPVKRVQQEISTAKDRLQTPDDLIREANDYRDNKVAAVYAEYQARMKKANAMDFDDLITQTVHLLQTCEDVRTYYNNRFHYVCIDEYQDTNMAQFMLAALLTERYHNLMVVGDDDQSIYKFRGATIENILNFEKMFDNVKVVKLEQNYRSTGRILSAANAVIAKNQGRHEKKLWTDHGDGTKLILRQLANQNEEARFITREIFRQVDEEGKKYSDFAVLYRTNAQSNALEQAFSKSAMPFRLLGGTRFYERKEIKDLMAYLCLIHNPADDLRLKRIINEPKRKIGNATLDAVEGLAQEQQTSMFDILCRADTFVALGRVASNLKSFAAMINTLRAKAETDTLPELVEAVLEDTGYRQMLEAAGPAEAERLENAKELISNAVTYATENDNATLAGFLEEVALVSDIDNYDGDANAVVLMTVHSAKGLEFPCVFLAGMEEGLFPSSMSMNDPADIEEERRLAYVAITRAKQKLYLLHVHDRLLYGRSVFGTVSRFVQEIPRELMDADERVTRTAPRPSAGGVSGSAKSPMFQSAPKTTSQSFVQASKPSKVYSAGARVKHASFGEGTILSTKPMGADTLYEILFDRVGIKKLMATYAKLTDA